MPPSQGFYANPYRGDAGAIISAPTGWVVESDLTDHERHEVGLCFLHAMGISKDEAFRRLEVMYFNLIPVGFTIEQLDHLIEDQNEVVLAKDPKASIELWQEDLDGRPVIFRHIYYHNDNYTEFSAFVCTNRFYAYLVASSLNRNAESNLAVYAM